MRKREKTKTQREKVERGERCVCRLKNMRERKERGKRERQVWGKIKKAIDLERGWGGVGKEKVKHG